MRGGRFPGPLVALAWCAIALAFLASCAGLRPGVTRQTIAAEYYAIAEAYADLEKYEKAIPYYQEATKQREFKNAARYGLGRSYALSGKWEEAADIFESLLAKDPENEMLRTAYSFSLVSMGRAEEALPLYKAVMDAHPDDPVLARNYAEVQIVAEKYADAIETVKSARLRFPESDIMKDFDDIEAKASEAIAAAEEEKNDPDEASDGEKGGDRKETSGDKVKEGE